MSRRAPWLPSILALVLVSCTGSSASPSTRATAEAGRADVGGYELAYQCQGTGGPTVVLEAGYGTGGTDAFFDFMPQLSGLRVCTYDRAGTGASDPRPASLEPVTGVTFALELHTLLTAIHEPGPYILVGHSFGGLLARSYATVYPDDVIGMVLIDATSEPEIPVYRRMHAGPWIDRTSRVNIDDIVARLRGAPNLDWKPLIVITAGIQEDKWLKRVPRLEARAQARLATMSLNAEHVVAVDSGHFVQDQDPSLVVEAIREVVASAVAAAPLPPCGETFPALGGRCL